MTLSSILLVDDDQDDYELTRTLIRQFDGGEIAVDWEPDFHRGLSSLLERRHDVALIDYRLGADNGVELLRSARARGCGTPSIILTGSKEREIDAEALSAGADDYLVKGEVTAEALERSLRYAVERRAALEAGRQREERLKQIEAALSKSEADYRASFENAPIGVAHTGLDGRWLRVNQRLRHLLGYPEDQLHGLTFAAITHPDDVGQSIEARNQLLAGAIPQYVREKRYRRATGDYVWVNLTVSLRRDDHGEPKHFIAIVEDISERKLAQQELGHIFDLSPDMICTSTFDGYFTRTNPAFTKTLGYSPEELKAEKFINFVHEDDRAATLKELGRVAEGVTTFGFTNRYRTADGSYRWIEWHSKTDTDARLIYSIARDQTDKRLLENQFRQSQKMEAVGRLAGGVAHDFNNLLTAILGFAEMTMEQLPEGDPRRKDIGHILHAGHSATALTRQLLAFSRKQILAPQVLDLNALVGDMQPMLRRLIGESVEIVPVLDDALLRINADRGQLEQVILNLVVNARDAMPGGGTLRLATDMVHIDDTFVAENPGSAPGHYVRLTIADTGTGMSPEVLAHLFEPFFTTKEQGKGTGLGLATVYGIVKQSGGYISVSSREGEGTAVTIHLPSVQSAAVPVAAKKGGDSATLIGTETILVVEDQREVREVIRFVLKRQGYTVLEAGDGVTALSLLQEHRGVVDLMLTDVVMPIMSGRELVARAHAQNLSVPVLYMSGYTDDEIMKHGVLVHDIDFLAKPFQRTQLLLRVREVLDRPVCRLKQG
ncbi:MAG: PAS domain S-box protein [Acidobacteriota bacterium]|nr:PAS domain S-box protein [Acidobacteriota bacterium]